MDAQHPQDLFIELAANYSIRISENVSLPLYSARSLNLACYMVVTTRLAAY